MEEINISRYLDLKDRQIEKESRNKTRLHIDFMPFYDYVPLVRDTNAIGNGIRFLNRYLSSEIFSNPEKWHAKLFEFIQLHKHNGLQLLVNGAIISDFDTLLKELPKAVNYLRTRKSDTPYSAVQSKLKKSGFEPGWGNTAARIIETMQMLIDLINEPAATLLGKFISRVPMPLISKVAILSPHGWFAQSNVLGKPDTGGQVIYILDQVRALEKHLKDETRLAGLQLDPKIIVITRLIPNAGDTTCNQKKEKIFETDNSWILRIPFKGPDDAIVKDWISRFKIWPYLEQFADDACTELLSEFQGRPDLIIGNYSDGNLVATLLSDKLDVIQCNIAHALEKTKYLFSDLYWQKMEKDYHFSVQFTADLLSMNKSDFIITSTFQEIYGTEDTMGQYESYQFFTLPQLYQVENGIHLHAPKFNVIRPGVDENLYYPFYEHEKRIENKTRQWNDRLFHESCDDVYGYLKNPEKPPIFTMARFDKIKNITGLIEAFGMSQKLQQHYNLVFAAGTIHLEASTDKEEQEEIRKAYKLIDQYKIQGKIRWLPSISKLDTGEVYRIMADHGGIFVQPALFEAFGLTVIEAMASGLPTFGPKFGGPLEIIEYGVSGFLLNTSKPELIAKSLESFALECQKDGQFWNKISKNGIQRVQEHFTWRLYSDTLVFLTKLYGFWRYSVSGKQRAKMDRYCDFIYHFLIRERTKNLWVK
jgi:sucrose synthase